MNQINQILIEGDVTNDIVETSHNTAEFKISTTCFRRNLHGQMVKVVESFDIQLLGSARDLWKERVQKGFTVRIVGYIKRERQRIVIVAEHIDLKPFADKEGEKCL